jgi:Tfp pilus assembly protein PilN
MNKIDFLPERIRDQRKRRRQLFHQGYLMALCIVGLGVMTYVLQLRVDKARGELEMLRSRSRAMDSQIALRDQLNQQLAELMIKSRIEEQLGRRVGTLDVLGELQKVMPESLTLTSMTMETVTVQVAADSAERRNTSNQPVSGGGAAKDKTVKRVRLVLTGMAPTDVDLANFIGQLAGSKCFEDVSMGYARNVSFRKRVAREFQANCYLTR